MSNYNKSLHQDKEYKMRIMNQELVTNEISGVQEAKLEVYIPLDMLAEKTVSMGEEVATVYVGRHFVSQLKEALAKLNPST
jgi:hypothetical protein